MNRNHLATLCACFIIVQSTASLHGKPPGDTAPPRPSSSGPESPSAAMRELAYGGDPLQKLDYWAPSPKGAPLVVFIHGGGWKRGDKRNSTGQKADHWVARGFAFASINYRLVPDATVEEQAADVAAALAFLRKDATRLGFNPDRVILIGHSAGAHLAALVGTDPQYLKNAGLSLKSLRGVILLDGACYDVPRQVEQGNNLMRDTYADAFGNNPRRQIALSPTHQAATPNAPAFLVLHIQRPDGTAQSRALGAALQHAGTQTEVHAIDGTGMQGHLEINRRLGDPDYSATRIVDTWINKNLGM